MTTKSQERESKGRSTKKGEKLLPFKNWAALARGGG